MTHTCISPLFRPVLQRKSNYHTRKSAKDPGLVTPPYNTVPHSLPATNRGSTFVRPSHRKPSPQESFNFIPSFFFSLSLHLHPSPRLSIIVLDSHLHLSNQSGLITTFSFFFVDAAELACFSCYRKSNLHHHHHRTIVVVSWTSPLLSCPVLSCPPSPSYLLSTLDAATSPCHNNSNGRLTHLMSLFDVAQALA